MADDTILWPLRAVSEDPTNVTKLDAENKVLTSTTDIANTFVQKAGDTMTGQLVVSPAVGVASPNGSVQVVGDSTHSSMALRWANNANGFGSLRFSRSRGTIATPLPVQAGDQCGVVTFLGLDADGTYRQTAALVGRAESTPQAGETHIKGSFLFNVNDGTGIKTPVSINGTLVSFQFPVALTGGITGNATVLAGGSVFVLDGLIQSRREGVDANIGIVSASFQASGIGKSVVGLACSVVGTGGVDFTAAIQVGNTVDAPTSYAIYSGSVAQSVIQGKLGLNRFVPARQLDVGGDAIVRGPLEVTGNITSSGTAHSFAAGSIGSPAVIGNTPRTIAATGSAGNAGQMVWDDNFLYLHTTAGWKKVELTAI